MSNHFYTPTKRLSTFVLNNHALQPLLHTLLYLNFVRSRSIKGGTKSFIVRQIAQPYFGDNFKHRPEHPGSWREINAMYSTHHNSILGCQQMQACTLVWWACLQAGGYVQGNRYVQGVWVCISNGYVQGGWVSRG